MSDTPSPFQNKSSKTPRTPTRASARIRQKSEPKLHSKITNNIYETKDVENPESQSKNTHSNPKLEKITKEEIPEQQENRKPEAPAAAVNLETTETQKANPQTEKILKNPDEQIIPLQTEKTPEEIEKPEIIQNTNNMNQQQIQQNIASFVPEFDGENTTKLSNNLTRFLGTADSIYETLNTEEEKTTFTRLIKLKLTGDAYMRISHRDVKNYTDLRNILNDMYARSHSLDELERGFTQVQQTYGETIRNYGYRLLEAMERYKSGYKTRYNLDNIDEAYTEHLNSTANKAFKSGLNNIILREKVATIKSKTIDDLITETETIERMLAESIRNPPTQQTVPQQIRTTPPLRNYSQRPTVTCNYCQRPNHTWDVCRTRMNQERIRGNTQPPQYNTPLQQYNTQSQNFPYRTQQTLNPFYNRSSHTIPENSHKQQPQINPQNTQNNPQPYFSQQQYRNQFQPFPQNSYFKQNTQTNKYAPKFCSHCKTTTGHTFDECRSKFFTGRQNQQQNQINPPAPPDTNTLTNKFNNMHINRIFPQQTRNTNIEQSQPENSKGSDQQ